MSPEGEPDGVALPKTDPPGRVERLRADAARLAAWADVARGEHTSVAVSFRAADRNSRVAASALSGGYAYRLFFWLLPFALIVGGAFGWMNADSPADAVDAGGLPYLVVDAVGDAVREAGMSPWLCLLIGVPGILWAGYTGAKATVLIYALVWDEPPPRWRAGPAKPAIAFTLLVLVLFGLVAVLSWVEARSVMGTLLAAALILVPFAGLWLWTSLQLPHADASWRELLPGALLFAVGIVLLQLVTTYALAANLERSTSVYGAVGAASTLLFWLYLVGRTVVTSPILNSSIYQERRVDRGEAAAGA